MITVRPYRDTDWPRLCEIHDAARTHELESAGLSSAYLTLEQTYENEGLFDDLLLVAELDGEIAGFVAYDKNDINWLYVEPRLWRHGVGGALMGAALGDCEYPVLLEVLEGNETAHDFYLNCGFVDVELRSGRLAGNEGFAASAHIMRLNGIEDFNKKGEQ